MEEIVKNRAHEAKLWTKSTYERKFENKILLSCEKFVILFLW